MPRTKVPPGSRSKRSCSRASSWRGANLSCCATSETDMPRASRALFSSAPTASVIFPPRQRLVLARGGEAPAQLVGVALLGDAFAELALYTQGQPQRFRIRRHQLVIARNQLARVVNIPLAIADLTELEKRRRLVGIELQGTLEEFFGVLDVVGAHAAHAGRGVRAPRRGVQRIAQRLQEVADRILLPPAVAKEPAEIVVDLRIVRRHRRQAARRPRQCRRHGSCAW